MRIILDTKNESEIKDTEKDNEKNIMKTGSSSCFL